MRYLKTVLVILFLYVFFSLPSTSCSSAEKAAQERRNLMMPKKSDLERNKKYIEPKKRKTYKPKEYKTKKQK